MSDCRVRKTNVGAVYIAPSAKHSEPLTPVGDTVGGRRAYAFQHALVVDRTPEPLDPDFMRLCAALIRPAFAVIRLADADGLARSGDLAPAAMAENRSLDSIGGSVSVGPRTYQETSGTSVGMFSSAADVARLAVPAKFKRILTNSYLRSVFKAWHTAC
jgi:hypothetical protein